MTPNITRFLDWIEAEKANGLLDLKGMCADGEGFLTKWHRSDLATRDALAAEFMDMLTAPVVPDPDFF